MATFEQIQQSYDSQPKAVVDQYGRPWQDQYGYQEGVAVPHVIQFTQVLQTAWKTYIRNGHDEALRSDPNFAKWMRNDPFLMGILNERARSTSKLRWHLEVDDERDVQQVAVRDALTTVLRTTSHRQKLIKYLTRETIWYGHSGSQLTTKPRMLRLPDPENPRGDRRPMEVPVVTYHEPVNGDSFVFEWDGTPCILVNTARSNELPRSAIIRTDWGLAVSLRGTYRSQFIVHKNEPIAADFFDGDQAGAIHGVGIRSFLYWLDWLRKELIGFILDLGERMGRGIRIWYYEASNPESERQVKKAAQTQTDRTNILVPRTKNAQGKTAEGLDLVDSSTAAQTLLLDVLKHWEGQIERFIIGQTGSSRSDSSGMGTHDTSMMDDTKHDIIVDDATNLEDTLTEDWVRPLQIRIFPKLADIPVRWVFEIDRPDPDQVMAAAERAFGMGVKFDENSVRSITGLPAPKDGDPIISAEALAKTQQAMQPQPPPDGGGGTSVPPNGGPDGPVPGAEGDDDIAEVMRHLGASGETQQQNSRREPVRRYAEGEPLPEPKPTPKPAPPPKPAANPAGAPGRIDAGPPHPGRLSNVKPKILGSTTLPKIMSGPLVDRARVKAIDKLEKGASAPKTPDLKPPVMRPEVEKHIGNLKLKFGDQAKAKLQKLAENSEAFAHESPAALKLWRGAHKLIAALDHAETGQYDPKHIQQVRDKYAGLTVDPDMGPVPKPAAPPTKPPSSPPVSAPAGDDESPPDWMHNGIFGEGGGTAEADDKGHERQPWEGDPEGWKGPQDKTRPVDHDPHTGEPIYDMEFPDETGKYPSEQKPKPAPAGSTEWKEKTGGPVPEGIPNRQEGLTQEEIYKIARQSIENATSDFKDDDLTQLDAAYNSGDPEKIKKVIANSIGANLFKRLYPDYVEPRTEQVAKEGFGAQDKPASVSFNVPDDFAGELLAKDLEHKPPLDLTPAMSKQIAAELRSGETSAAKLFDDAYTTQRWGRTFEPGNFPDLAKMFKGPKADKGGVDFDLDDGPQANLGEQAPATPTAAATPFSPASEHHAKIDAAITQSLDAAKHLSPDQAKEYHGYARAVTSRLTPQAAEHVANNLKGVQFHKSVEDLDTDVRKRYPTIAAQMADIEKRGGNASVGGLYDQNTGTMFVDGPTMFSDGSHGGNEIYAHEFGHAIDGENFRFSDDPEWRAAWKREIANSKSAIGPLGDYGGDNAREGWAEMARLVYGQGVSPDELRQRFPQSAAFLAKHGLLPGSKEPFERPVPIFDKAVEDPTTKTHADTLLPPEQQVQLALADHVGYVKPEHVKRESHHDDIDIVVPTKMGEYTMNAEKKGGGYHIEFRDPQGSLSQTGRAGRAALGAMSAMGSALQTLIRDEIPNTIDYLAIIPSSTKLKPKFPIGEMRQKATELIDKQLAEGLSDESWVNRARQDIDRAFDTGDKDEIHHILKRRLLARDLDHLFDRIHEKDDTRANIYERFTKWIGPHTGYDVSVRDSVTDGSRHFELTRKPDPRVAENVANLRQKHGDQAAAKFREVFEPWLKANADNPKEIRKVLRGKETLRALEKGRAGPSMALDFPRKSNAPFQVTASQAKEVEDFVKKQIPGADVHEIPSLFGVPDDATKTMIHMDGSNEMGVYVEHPDVGWTAPDGTDVDDSIELSLKKAKYGDPYMYIDWVGFKKSAQGKGLGTNMIGSMIENSQKAGIKSIRCHAAKDNPRNPKDPLGGYYVWPKMGFDADIISVENAVGPRKSQEIKQNWPDAKSLLDIMNTPDGNSWWLKNGADIPDARFDTTPGSRSMQVWEKYQAAKRAKS